MRFLFKHFRRTQLIHEEVVCQQHRDEMSVKGGYMEPLTPQEHAAGLKFTFTPYEGDRECACCAEAAGRQMRV